MKVLVIGLGSMGRRRVRCLKKIGVDNILGFDIRDDRNITAQEDYSIQIIRNVGEVSTLDVDFIIISTPPDHHLEYMKIANKSGKPFFVEASVISDGLADLNIQIANNNTKCYPSTTLFFHPAIKQIKTILTKKVLGPVLQTTLHSGQFLPDWHAYEDVSDFYVSNRKTGGCREIVPFELTWFVALFGKPQRVSGVNKKTRQIRGAETIDDLYCFWMEYSNMVATFNIDVISRFATRMLLINGEDGQLRWSWENNYLELYLASEGKWQKIYFDLGEHEGGYNPNISENMYIEELSCVIDDISGNRNYPNTLSDDIEVLGLLNSIELSYKNQTSVEI